MFEQTFLEATSDRATRWSIAGSFVAQCVLITLCVLLPLVYTKQIPVHQWAVHVFLPAPPPPPPPPVPQVNAPPPPPRRFEAVMVAPRAVPDEVALIDDRDAGTLASTLEAPSVGSRPGGESGGVSGGVLGVVHRPELPPKPRPIRIGGRVQAARLVHRVLPVYPEEALEEGITGSVHLEAMIDRDGRIRELRVLSGHPLLVASAMEAIKQWRYRPTRLNGTFVEVVTRININFEVEVPPENDEQATKKKKASAARRPSRGPSRDEQL